MFLGEVREIKKVLTRSSGWGKTRKTHILSYPTCYICGKRKGVQVHHKKPFYLFPELELDPKNLITFCGDHHLWIGHLGWWKTYNPDVVTDAMEWYKKYRDRKLWISDWYIRSINNRRNFDQRK